MFGIPDEYVPSLIALAGALFTGLVGLATGLHKSDSRRARLERDASLLEQIPESAARTRLLDAIDWQIGEIHQVDRHGERDWFGVMYGSIAVFLLGPLVWRTFRDSDASWWAAGLAVIACFLMAGLVFATIGAIQKKPFYARNNIVSETLELIYRWLRPHTYTQRRLAREAAASARARRGRTPDASQEA